jgi:50S ribosomal protein L16 3-hydroxylase
MESSPRRGSPVLETLFPGTTRERFASEHWLQDHPVVSHGDLGRLSGLLDLSELEDIEASVLRHKGDIMSTHPGPTGELRDCHALSPPQALVLYDCGATLHLNRFDLSFTGGARLVGRLAEELGLPASSGGCTAFASKGPGPGTPLHCDNKDIFVVQLVGTKRWRVAPNTQVDTPTVNLHPWAKGGATVLRNMHVDTTTIDLSPGSVLFLPRAHWHGTEVASPTAFAITMGVRRPTWLEILGASLHNHLRSDATFRMAIGSAWGTPSQQAAVREQFAQRLDRLAEELRAVDPWTLFQRASDRPSLKFQRRREASLAVEESLDTAAGTIWTVSVATTAGTESFEVDDRRVLDVVAWIADRSDALTVRDLAATFPDSSLESLRGLVDKLVAAGLVDSLPELCPPMDLTQYR